MRAHRERVGGVRTENGDAHLEERGVGVFVIVSRGNVDIGPRRGVV